MKPLMPIIFFATFLLLWNNHFAQAQVSETLVQEFNTPVEAPNFLLKEISGEEVSLKEFRGKIVLLNFFTTW
jgi:cytochrome oxidase Cu insertion factor (SCO1/SenC/PrrC family)